jgi:hypothetical protein
MADRFPSFHDIDTGKLPSQASYRLTCPLSHANTGQTEPAGQPTTDALSSEEPSDFLARERAALGEDAQQCTSSAD